MSLENEIEAEEPVHDLVDAEAERATGQIGLEAQVDQQVVVEQVENGQHQAHGHEVGQAFLHVGAPNGESLAHQCDSRADHENCPDRKEDQLGELAEVVEAKGSGPELVRHSGMNEKILNQTSK